MKIIDLICSAGSTGFYFDDQMAIKEQAVADGNIYLGTPVTPGFTKIRQPGESVSILLVLENGQIAHGDCVAVQYSGAAGRDPLFLAKDYIPMIEKEIKPLLKGREITTFRAMAKEFEDYRTADGRQLHTAIRYGLSQAFLDAVAKSQTKLMAKVVADEYGLKVSEKPIALMCQSGDDRYLAPDKMIMKMADALPHGLINNVKDKLGQNGEKLREYLQWIVKRIEALRPVPGYQPVIHFDVYGTLSPAFNNDLERIADYLGDLEKLARPFSLRIEGPVDMGDRDKQIAAVKKLTELLAAKSIAVELVVDEWCNTVQDVRDFADQKAGHMIQIKAPDLGGLDNAIEAVVYCRSKGIRPYLGGSCNETGRSAQVCIHAAMGSSPDLFLSKPGMGVDEGFMVAQNEMGVIISLMRAGFGG